MGGGSAWSLKGAGMQISIRAHIREATRDLEQVHRRHIPFATVYAATLTAKAVKVAEIQAMRNSFDRPTDYVLNALRSTPATKSHPVATVEFKDFSTKSVPAKRFLNPEISGGPRSRKSHELRLGTILGTQYVVPGKDMPLDAHGNLKAATYMQIVSQLKVAADASQNASNSRRSKAKRKTNAFYKLEGRPIIMQRQGDVVRPALIGVRAPQYQSRFDFYGIAERMVGTEFPKQFEVALSRSIAKSNYRGKW